MIEVNMTVNELTENTEMDVGMSVKADMKNPFFTIKLINNNDPSVIPIRIRTLSAYDVINGNLIDSPIVASPMDYAVGRSISLYDEQMNMYYLDVPQTYVVSDDEVDLVNCTFNAFLNRLIITDTSQDASAVLIIYE